MKLLALRSAALLLGALAACARPAAVPAPTGEPYLTGRVESFSHHATASRLLVQPLNEGACGIAATVDARTRHLHRAPSGELRAGSRAEVREGDTIAVFVDGPVMRSCPAQGYASAVILDARP
jgi:hypothetical protein